MAGGKCAREPPGHVRKCAADALTLHDVCLDENTRAIEEASLPEVDFRQCLS